LVVVDIDNGFTANDTTVLTSGAVPDHRHCTMFRVRFILRERWPQQPVPAK